jgi:hypothetical protein
MPEMGWSGVPAASHLQLSEQRNLQTFGSVIVEDALHTHPPISLENMVTGTWNARAVNHEAVED